MPKPTLIEPLEKPTPDNVSSSPFPIAVSHPPHIDNQRKPGLFLALFDATFQLLPGTCSWEAVSGSW